MSGAINPNKNAIAKIETIKVPLSQVNKPVEESKPVETPSEAVTISGKAKSEAVKTEVPVEKAKGGTVSETATKASEEAASKSSKFKKAAAGLMLGTAIAAAAVTAVPATAEAGGFAFGMSDGMGNGFYIEMHDDDVYHGHQGHHGNIYNPHHHHQHQRMRDYNHGYQDGRIDQYQQERMNDMMYGPGGMVIQQPPVVVVPNVVVTPGMTWFGW